MSEVTCIRVALSPAELQALDRWRAANAMSSRSAAGRYLIQLGLKVASPTSGEADLEPAAD